MPQMLSPRATWAVLRAGDLRARLRMARDGQAALRLAMGAAAIATGLVDALAAGPRTTTELRERAGGADPDLMTAWLRVAEAAGLIRAGGDGWRLTRRGQALAHDDLVRAGHEAFAGYHTGLYRELGPLLAGTLRRRDVADEGELIARLSAGFEPFVLGELTRTVTRRRPRRVLDVGCGAGVHLAAMLTAAPGAEGVGVDVDADAVALATRTLRRRGLDGRSRVVHADVRDLRRDPATGTFDLVLLANVVYYVPAEERPEFLRALAALVAPGGALLLMTTVAAPQLLSRHFDLLLRGQEGRMELPETGVLLAQLTDAGLRPGPPQRVAPGDPLVVIAATRES